jgi:twitching motility protein PilT
MINFTDILKKAFERKASDVHLMVDRPATLRVDGMLIPLNDVMLSAKDLGSVIDKILTPEQRQRFDAHKDIDLSYDVSGARFRVNVCIERGNLSLVARVIPTVIPTFKELDLPETVGKLTTAMNGLILVTGPTGSGKSTTLAAMIQKINDEQPVNIVTLEDPIEFLFTPNKALIRQRELGGDMTSFPEGLKHVLRQDPNVIMVGEMRDLETVSAALTLAETGHLVLSTLHTPSASQAVDRIIDMFPPYHQNQIRSQMALSLRAVIAQHLVPREGGGRVAVREMLLNSPAVGTMIRENKVAQIPNVMQTSPGMFIFHQSVRELLKEGLISEDVADMFKKAATD